MSLCYVLLIAYTYFILYLIDNTIYSKLISLTITSLFKSNTVMTMPIDNSVIKGIQGNAPSIHPWGTPYSVI